MLVFLIACTAKPGETVEPYEAEYDGVLEQELMDEGVEILEDTVFGVDLFMKDGVLWAGATISGKIAKGPIVIDGTESADIEGVTVDGDTLACQYATPTKVLDVNGTFREERAWLDLEVEDVGTVIMALVVDGE